MNTTDPILTAVLDSAEALRGRCMEVLARGDFTADEVAKLVGGTPLGVRPRITELKTEGKVEPLRELVDGEVRTVRRKNESGIRATVWTRVMVLNL